MYTNLTLKKITFRVPEGFEDCFVAQGVLATLHNESKPIVDALMSLLLLKMKTQINQKIIIIIMIIKENTNI